MNDSILSCILLNPVPKLAHSGYFPDVLEAIKELETRILERQQSWWARLWKYTPTSKPS